MKLKCEQMVTVRLSLQSQLGTYCISVATVFYGCVDKLQLDATVVSAYCLVFNVQMAVRELKHYLHTAPKEPPLNPVPQLKPLITQMITIQHPGPSNRPGVAAISLLLPPHCPHSNTTHSFRKAWNAWLMSSLWSQLVFRPVFVSSMKIMMSRDNN